MKYTKLKEKNKNLKEGIDKQIEKKYKETWKMEKKL